MLLKNIFFIMANLLKLNNNTVQTSMKISKLFHIFSVLLYCDSCYCSTNLCSETVKPIKRNNQDENEATMSSVSYLKMKIKKRIVFYEKKYEQIIKKNPEEKKTIDVYEANHTKEIETIEKAYKSIVDEAKEYVKEIFVQEKIEGKVQDEQTIVEINQEAIETLFENENSVKEIREKYKELFESLKNKLQKNNDEKNYQEKILKMKCKIYILFKVTVIRIIEVLCMLQDKITLKTIVEVAKFRREVSMKEDKIEGKKNSDVESKWADQEEQTITEAALKLVSDTKLLYYVQDLIFLLRSFSYETDIEVPINKLGLQKEEDEIEKAKDTEINEEIRIDVRNEEFSQNNETNVIKLGEMQDATKIVKKFEKISSNENLKDGKTDKEVKDRDENTVIKSTMKPNDIKLIEVKDAIAEEGRKANISQNDKVIIPESDVEISLNENFQNGKRTEEVKDGGKNALMKSTVKPDDIELIEVKDDIAEEFRKANISQNDKVIIPESDVEISLNENFQNERRTEEVKDGGKNTVIKSTIKSNDINLIEVKDDIAEEFRKANISQNDKVIIPESDVEISLNENFQNGKRNAVKKAPIKLEFKAGTTTIKQEDKVETITIKPEDKINEKNISQNDEISEINIPQNDEVDETKIFGMDSIVFVVILASIAVLASIGVVILIIK